MLTLALLLTAWSAEPPPLPWDACGDTLDPAWFVVARSDGGWGTFQCESLKFGDLPCRGAVAVGRLGVVFVRSNGTLFYELRSTRTGTTQSLRAFLDARAGGTRFDPAPAKEEGAWWGWGWVGLAFAGEVTLETVIAPPEQASLFGVPGGDLLLIDDGVVKPPSASRIGPGGRVLWSVDLPIAPGPTGLSPATNGATYWDARVGATDLKFLASNGWMVEAATVSLADGAVKTATLVREVAGVGPVMIVPGTPTLGPAVVAFNAANRPGEVWFFDVNLRETGHVVIGAKPRDESAASYLRVEDGLVEVLTQSSTLEISRWGTGKASPATVVPIDGLNAGPSHVTLARSSTPGDVYVFVDMPQTAAVSHLPKGSTKPLNSAYLTSGYERAGMARLLPSPSDEGLVVLRQVREEVAAKRATLLAKSKPTTDNSRLSGLARTSANSGRSNRTRSRPPPNPGSSVPPWGSSTTSG